jgi:hypothetical protein
MAVEEQRRIRALRPFSYSLDGVRLIAVAVGEEISLRAGTAAGLVAEGYAEAMAAADGEGSSAPSAPARRQPTVRRASARNPNGEPPGSTGNVRADGLGNTA